MRLDRLITLGLVAPLRRALTHLPILGRPPSTVHRILPILMYHSISDDPEPGVSPYYKVCTSPRRFAEHMQWLAELGYRGVTLRDGLAWLKGSKSSDESHSHSHSPLAKLVAITFDDGFRNFHTSAFPVLQRHGFAATMYLPTAFIGDDRQSFKSRECLTWEEVRELAGAGMEFGSHTVNHPVLVSLSWAEIETELRESKTNIEQRLKQPVPAFAYPYAFPQAEKTFARRFCALLEQIGYETGVTTMVGRGRDGSSLLQLPRLPANSADDCPLFEAKLRGACDWLALPQFFGKSLAHWIHPTKHHIPTSATSQSDSIFE